MNQAALSVVVLDKYFQYAPLLHLFDNICSTNLYLSTNKYVPMLSAIVIGTLYNALVFSQDSKGPLVETIDFISFFWSRSLLWGFFHLELYSDVLFLYSDGGYLTAKQRNKFGIPEALYHQRAYLGVPVGFLKPL